MPLDRDYARLLRPVLFTIVYLQLRPRIALERDDSGEPRIVKILELIQESKFAIHDISRLKALRAGELSRLNMPFELGLDVGCRYFGSGILSEKRCLILETERYRYQAALSDLSGSDIVAYRDRPKELMSAVRNWLVSQCSISEAGPTHIWIAFVNFTREHSESLKQRGFSVRDIENCALPELVSAMEQWVSRHKRA